LILIFFCIIAANSSLTFFGPSVVKEVGFTNPATVGWIMALSYLCGAAGMIYNGLHSDRHQECRLHCAYAAAVGALGMALTALFMKESPMIALAAQTLAIVGTMSAIPVFWQLPGRFLAGAAAAGGVALINSIANLAGFGAPYMLGLIKTSTGLLSPGLFIVAAVEICATLLIIAFVPRLAKKVAQ
jgi:MFS family permease